MSNIFLYKQLYILREEIHSLKRCQLTFMTVSITSTGGILSFVQYVKTIPEIFGLFFLIPLIIIIPSWLIFFDKARSISRCVGYNRIIERLLSGNNTNVKLSGWESDLSNFRKFKPKIESIIRILEEEDILKENHSYWLFCYSIFATLSWLCIFAMLAATFFYYNNILVNYFFTTINLFALIITLTIVIFTTQRCWKIYSGFTDGIYSYTFMEYKWKELLKSQ